MHKTEFEVKVGNRYLSVVAKAKKVDSFEVKGLRLEVFDEDGNQLETLPESVITEIKERAHEELEEAQYEMRVG